jgi:hypothetical protein
VGTIADRERQRRYRGPELVGEAGECVGCSHGPSMIGSLDAGG